MAATFTQPDNTTQSAAAYKAAIDAAVAVLARMGGAFAPRAQNTPNMTVRLDAGVIFTASSALTEVAAQNTGTITAPVGNPRIDRVVIDALTGAVSVVTGTPAGSPVAPAIPVGKLPVCRVLLQTSSTSITNSMITDERTSSVNGAGFPAGTVMLFVQTSAPVGWTKGVTHNDKALRLVSGSVSTGGSVAFTTAFASQTPAGTVGNTTLNTTQMPAHTHTESLSTDNTSQSGQIVGTSRGASLLNTGSTGGGGSHTHSFTGTAMNLAVNYVDVIMATKD